MFYYAVLHKVWPAFLGIWASCCFPFLSIFFIHIIIQEKLSEYIKLFEIIKPIRVIILFVMSFIISILITYILSKIKVIKTKVLLIKD